MWHGDAGSFFSGCSVRPAPRRRSPTSAPRGRPGQAQRRRSGNRPPTAGRSCSDPVTPYLVWSATTTSSAAPRMNARLVSASSRFGVVKPARSVIPCTPMKSTSMCSEDSARHRHRSDQRIRWRADTPGEDDVEGGRCTGVQDLGHRDRVGHDGERPDIEHLGQHPGGRSGGEPDRTPGPDPCRCSRSDRFLEVGLQRALHIEAGFFGGGPLDQRGTAVELLHQPGPLQTLEITTDRHLRHPERLARHDTLTIPSGRRIFTISSCRRRASIRRPFGDRRVQNRT